MIKEEPHIKFICVYQSDSLLLSQTHPSSDALSLDFLRESHSAFLQVNRLQLQALETQRINSASGQWNVLRGTDTSVFFFLLASHPFPERQSYLAL